jgi:hypothetical protein
VKVEVSAIIRRPVEEVFALAGNPAEDPRWAAAVAEARQLTDGPLGVGTRFEQVLRLLGRRIRFTCEVTHYEPNRSLHIGRFSGRLRSASGRRTFESIADGTHVTFVGEGGSGLFLNLLEPIVTAAARKAATRDLARLKAILESDQH